MPNSAKPPAPAPPRPTPSPSQRHPARRHRDLRRRGAPRRQAPRRMEPCRRQPRPAQPLPHAATPHSSTPHASAPHAATPHSATPRAAAPHSAAPYSATSHAAAQSAATSLDHALCVRLTGFVSPFCAKTVLRESASTDAHSLLVEAASRIGVLDPLALGWTAQALLCRRAADQQRFADLFDSWFLPPNRRKHVESRGGGIGALGAATARVWAVRTPAKAPQSTAPDEASIAGLRPRPNRPTGRQLRRSTGASRFPASASAPGDARPRRIDAWLRRTTSQADAASGDCRRLAAYRHSRHSSAQCEPRRRAH